MVPTGDMTQSRYIVKDDEGRIATSYNLGLGKALALRWAKIACKELKGEVFLQDQNDPYNHTSVFKYSSD